MDWKKQVLLSVNTDFPFQIQEKDLYFRQCWCCSYHYSFHLWGCSSECQAWITKYPVLGTLWIQDKQLTSIPGRSGSKQSLPPILFTVRSSTVQWVFATGSFYLTLLLKSASSCQCLAPYRASLFPLLFSSNAFPSCSAIQEVLSCLPQPSVTKLAGRRGPALWGSVYGALSLNQDWGYCPHWGYPLFVFLSLLFMPAVNPWLCDSLPEGWEHT